MANQSICAWKYRIAAYLRPAIGLVPDEQQPGIVLVRLMVCVFLCTAPYVAVYFVPFSTCRRDILVMPLPAPWLIDGLLVPGWQLSFKPVEIALSFRALTIDLGIMDHKHAD